MKKFLMFLMLSFATSTFAENYVEHALIVRHLSYWAPEYLTVTNNWNNMCLVQAPSTLKSLSVIIEINGESTKDMEPNDFYSIIDRESSFTLTYYTKIRGENKRYTHQLTKRKGMLHYGSGHNTYVWNRERNRMNSSTIMSDQDVDLFKYCTYDYMVAGDDYITDKNLLQEFAKQLDQKGMKHVTENPDVYLYLTKDINQDIESIYVPNIISTTTTSGRANVYIGNYSVWGNHRETSTTHTRDIGTTKEFVSADLFLQFSILDAHMMEQNTPPVVWQFTHNRHFSSSVKLLDEAKRLQYDIYCYPANHVYWYFNRYICTLGCFFQNELSESGLVCDIADGSWADKNGIKEGWVLKKVKAEGSNGTGYKSVTRKFSPKQKKGYSLDGILNEMNFTIQFDKNTYSFHSNTIFPNYIFSSDKNTLLVPYYFISN